jgi:hypothetical protein
VSFFNDGLLAFRASDGVLLRTTTLKPSLYLPVFAAADPSDASGRFFISSLHAGVGEWAWTAGGEGGARGAFVQGPPAPHGGLESLVGTEYCRPLAFVPASTDFVAPSSSGGDDGQQQQQPCSGHLVVGVFDTPRLHVLSMPHRRFVHTHTLDGMRVTDLAADPSGTVLAVCDMASGAVHTLAWPLAGMPGAASSSD